MKQLRWQYPIRTEIFTWNNRLVYQNWPIAGLPHLFEHLMVRAFDNSFGEDESSFRSRTNGATTPDLFYIHRSSLIHSPYSLPRDLIDRSMIAKHVTEEEFEIERKIIASEISERQTLANKIQTFVLKEYLDAKPWEQCLLGNINEISQLGWDQVYEVFKSISPLFEHYILEPQLTRKPQDMRRPVQRIPCLKYDLRKLLLGERHVFLVVILSPIDSIISEVRISFLEHLLRHAAKGENINNLLRDTYQISYGVHGLRVQKGKKKALALIAVSDEPIPNRLQDEVHTLMKSSPTRLNQEFSMIHDRLLIESALYRSIHNHLGVIPQNLSEIDHSDIEFILNQEDWRPFKDSICRFNISPFSSTMRESEKWNG